MNYLNNNKLNWYNKGMTKPLLIVSIFVLSSLMIFSVTQAASTTSTGRKPFGGKIINEEANQIMTLESSGWTCAVPGDTFDIKPVGKSLSGPYLVPAGIEAKSNGPATPGKWVLGLHSTTTTPITCTFPDPPATTVVNTYPISLFGLSKL